MKMACWLLAVGLVAAPVEVLAQEVIDEPLTGDYLANASQQRRDGRPLVGLVRRADFVAVQLSFVSDSRDGLVRKDEIHTMLRGALDKARASGFELVTGSPILTPVTTANYTNLPLTYAGREDTSQAVVMVKLPLSGDNIATQKALDGFVASLPRKGRGTVTRNYGRLLVIRNPAQYRPAIVKLIAEDARANAEAFGPDYRASVDGLDKAVQWSQLNDSDVFLYVPYSYKIEAK